MFTQNPIKTAQISDGLADFQQTKVCPRGQTMAFDGLFEERLGLGIQPDHPTDRIAPHLGIHGKPEPPKPHPLPVTRRLDPEPDRRARLTGLKVRQLPGLHLRHFQKQVERMELVRSELSVRGLWKQAVERKAFTVRQEEPTLLEDVQDKESPAPPLPSLPDLFDEWREERAACGDDHVDAWQEAFRSVLRDARHDPVLTVSVLKHQRMLHGEQKRHDRSSGIRRYRLRAFE